MGVVSNAGAGGRRARPPHRSRPQWQAPGGAARRGRRDRVAQALAAVALWAAAVAGLGAAASAAGTAVRAAGPARVDDAVTLAAAAAGLALAWWLAVAVLATAAAALLGRSGRSGPLTRVLSAVARRTAPALVRRAVVVTLGVGLSGLVVAGPAGAAPGQDGGPARPGPAAVAALDPGWGASDGPVDGPAHGPADGGDAAADAAGPVDASLAPGWVPSPPGPRSATATPGTAASAAASPSTMQTADTTGTAAAAAGTTLPGPRPRARHVARAEVVVHRGDTLWTIVERHLGPSATAARVAAEWPRWHAANADVIGPDPDRLRPGQRLRPPEGTRARDRVRPPAATTAPVAGTPR